MNLDRRKFLKKLSLGTGMVSAFSSVSFVTKGSKPNAVSLKIAGYDVNRVKALAQGFKYQYI